MHNLKFLKYNIQFPGNWNELTTNQLLFSASLFNRNFSKETFFVLIIQNFTGIKWDDFFKMPVTAITEISEKLKFLLEQPELTENKLKKIRIKNKTIYGTENALLNVTFEQYFGHVEPAFAAYMNDEENIEMLNYMISSLYAFESDTGKFNPDLIPGNMDLMHKLQIKYKYAVLLFYLGCRDLLSSKFPKLFSNKKIKGTNELAYFEMIENLNNENISNNNAVKESNIYEAFIRLTKMIEKNEELRKT